MTYFLGILQTIGVHTLLGLSAYLLLLTGQLSLAQAGFFAIGAYVSGILTVISLTYKKILELYQIREAMEGYATRLASSEMTQSEIDGLYRLLEQHNEQVQSSGEHVYIQQEGNLDFHYYIYSKCNNQWLFDYLDNKLYQLLRMCRQHTAKISSRADLGLIEHTAIVNAISNRDGELSELLMRRHINGAWKTIKDIVIEEDLKKDKSI
ncbi:FCD domain-containing protein [Candidatus Thioglobus sp.]|nr:FCD domain-containing protein [Candidatus Thioglobus sp.]